MKRAIFTFYNLSLDIDIVRLQEEVVRKFNTTADFLERTVKGQAGAIISKELRCFSSSSLVIVLIKSPARIRGIALFRISSNSLT